MSYGPHTHADMAKQQNYYESELARLRASEKALLEAMKYLLSELPDQLDSMPSASKARAAIAQAMEERK
jgi:hypothetical protein